MNELGYQGKWVVVFYSVAVQNLIVLDWLHISILFPNEEKGSSIGGFQRVDIVAFLLFLEEFIEGIVFVSWHRVDFAVDRAWGVWEEVNGMIPFSQWGKSSRCLLTKYLLVLKVFWRYEFIKLWFSFSSRLLSSTGSSSCFV